MTDPVSHDAGVGHVQETVRRHSGLLLLQAILMIGAGVLAFFYPLITTVAVSLFLGWMLIISGIAQAISLVVTSRVPHFWLQLVSAVLSVVVGFLMVRNPALAVGTLALLLIIYFMVEGIAKIAFALTVRPLPNWGWVLLSGVIGVAISFWLIANPALSILVLGLFIGIQLVAEGIAIGWLAWNARKA